jgi:hypothetical protein
MKDDFGQSIELSDLMFSDIEGEKSHVERIKLC